MKKWERYGPKIDVAIFSHTSVLFIILGVQYKHFLLELCVESFWYLSQFTSCCVDYEIISTRIFKKWSQNFIIMAISKVQTSNYSVHCKPKPCIAHRELPVSQFPQGKTCFHYREPLFSLQGPCFHYRDFPVNPCTSLLGIAVLPCLLIWPKFAFALLCNSPVIHKVLGCERFSE